MKVSDLISAELDYWIARAEGVPAEALEIRPVQRPDPRTPDTICVRKIAYRNGEPCAVIRLAYSTNPALWGPLIKKHTIAVSKGSNQISFPGWYAALGLTTRHDEFEGAFGDEPEIAICRAVVRSVFGDEVEDLP